MLQVFLFLLIFIDFSWISHGKRLRTFQSQHELGELCMPGTCVSINANCKRIIGGSFRCVCKDQYLAVNRTHCLRIINPSIDDGCASCEEKHGICLDEDQDDHLDRCYCPPENPVSQQNQTSRRISSTPKPENQSFDSRTKESKNPKINAKMFIGTDLDGNDDIVMSIYNIDQKQWLMKRRNQSMMIFYHSDHLYIDLKYRRNLYHPSTSPTTRHHDRMIIDQCELMFNITQKQQQTVKRVSLSQHGCPSSIDFRTVDQDHVRSSVFSIEHTDEQRLVLVLQCWIRLCLDQNIECQQSRCSSKQTNSLSTTNHTYEMRRAHQAFILQRVSFSSQNFTTEHRSSASQEGKVAYSLMIGVIAVIFLVLLSVSLFIIDRRCLAVRSSANSLIEMINSHDVSAEEKMRNQYEDSSEYDLQDRWKRYIGHPNVVMTNIQRFSNDRQPN